MAECSRDDALELGTVRGAHHSVGFATARLSVREDCAIIALHHRLDQIERSCFVDCVLSRADGEDCVVGEVFVIIWLIQLQQYNLVRLFVGIDDVAAL